MFTAKPQKNRNAATTYFDEHLSHNDYYTQGETQAGYWVGQGAQRLGLKEGEAVNREAFLRLCDNQRPDSGEQLTQRQFAGRRVFFDFTCSAPKSVSILAVTMDDKRILQAHREASDVALKELEAYAGTRVRKGGAMEDRTTANLVGAAFRHTSSRALDPQLHTHFTLFNATLDPVEQRWKALQSSRMYDAIKYGTAVYRNELANRLHGLGYGTRQTAHGFEVQGVDSKIISRFSKRSKQRDEAVAKMEKKLGHRLNKDEISNVVHKSRPKKLKDASEAEVRGQQLNELGFFEKRALKRVIAEANGVAWKPQTMAERVHLGQATQYAQEHVFARQSVAPAHQLLEAALVKGYGQIALPELKQALQRNPDLVRVGSEYSTRAILQSEIKLLHTVNAGVGTVRPLAPRFEGPVHLSQDQRSALGHVFFAEDRITGFKGLAGTGKTTTLKEFGRVVKEVGHEGVFLAPTTGAVDVLKKDGFKSAMTLAKLLTDPEQQAKVSEKTVFVLDEAGAVGTKDMQQLFDLAEKTNARVVLSGDTGQHAAVAQGDALRLIEEHSRYRFAVLGEIRRQTKETFRQAVKLAAEKNPAAAFKLLKKEGAVIEASTDHGQQVRPGQQLYGRVAEAYLHATDAGKTVLLVSPTWGEIAAVTETLREQLKKKGVVTGQEEKRSVYHSLGWTDAQKSLVTHYEPGQQIRFVQKTEQFQAGDIAEVADVKGKTVLLRGSAGQSVAFHPSRSPSSFDVGEARELKVAPGDWLLLQSNAKGFTNGERVQIKTLAPGGIALKDGRTLPPSYRTFQHGYAITSHAAQGKTVDVALFVASSRSFAAVSRESFYVGISRARESVQVFTDDAELLARRVEDTHTRKAALELQGLREALAKHGLVRPPQEEEKKKAAVKITAERESVSRITRALRPMRTQALVPILAVQKWSEDFRRWVGEKMGLRVEPPAERVERVQRALRVDMPPLRQRPDEPRQGHGIRM
jgi:conjugative relaxase-like TrwC/TraI family protein